MKHLILWTLGVATLLMAACDGTDKVGELATQVIAIHDEVMPKMGEIKSLKQELSSRIESLDAAPEPDTVRIAEYRNAMRALVEGEKAMWDWMHAYKTPEQTTPDAEALQYLEAEMVKVGEVKEKILTSIEQAKGLLGQ
ncbi:MAG: hypothetical protein OHK0039_11430 [Bacteroidia bacterium]